MPVNYYYKIRALKRSLAAAKMLQKTGIQGTI